MRWFFALFLFFHALIHTMGFLKAFGLAELAQLTQPINRAMGVWWLIAAVLLLLALVFMLVASRWWFIGALALVVSQAVIVSSWSDAKVGTLANVVLLLLVVHGFLSQGPRSYRAEYAEKVRSQLARAAVEGIVTEADLARLPAPLARYLRLSGVVGQPRVFNFRARWRGAIRSGPEASWMSFTAEQVNRFGPDPSRLFFMEASMFGVPVDVLHSFLGPSATMRVKAGSLLKMVEASGPEMNQGETVTLFNDWGVLAPAALIEPSPVGAHR
jgi:diadenosine tetraphosphatase ApaH/serine/threonine PP2A family protein phosphatase